jgi:DNA-binding CsgD family transcriptional regulator
MNAPSPSFASPSAATVLVCAPTDGEPSVVLADGSYETEGERVFWRHDREATVLRLPIDAPVSVRPLRHFPSQRPAPQEEALPRAEHVEDPLAVLRRRLAEALAAADHTTAEALAARLWRHGGLAGVHTALAASLAEAGATWAKGGGSVLHERQLSTSARALLERLRATSLAPSPAAPLVLAVPEGERHTLALTALAHQFQELGRGSVVVEDLPLGELCLLLRARRSPALVVSAHLPVNPKAVRRLVAAVREASPDTLVVFGGPGVPRGVRGPDLVTEDCAAVLHLLDGRSEALSQREHEVLTAVADGQTNGEIAVSLGVAPATVKSHLDRVFAKTGTESRAAAVAYALRHGWIT